MKRYLIKRKMEGAGDIPKNDLNAARKSSEEVLETMRSEVSSVIRHNTSFVG